MFELTNNEEATKALNKLAKATDKYKELNLRLVSLEISRDILLRNSYTKQMDIQTVIEGADEILEWLKEEKKKKKSSTTHAQN